MSVATAAVSRAARFRAPGDIQVETLEMGAPGAGQVCVRLEGCGVCGSNLPVWEGRSWFNYPLEAGTPGHEGWGVVESVGEGVKALAIGDRVAMLSGHAFAERDCAAPESLVKLPPELDGKPFPGEPLACAMNIFRRSDILPGQRVAIVGVGFLGAALTALAVRAGAQVVALSRRAAALEKAEEAGATATIRLEDSSQAVRDAQQCAGGEGYERVIECVGTQAALDVASALAAVRGRLVIAGYHQDGERRVNMQDWNWRGLDVINAHERDPAQYRRGMEEAIDLVVRGEFNPWPLFTHEFPLEDISAAFEALAQRPDGFLKALVRTP